jgi:hypothetical protein
MPKVDFDIIGNLARRTWQITTHKSVCFTILTAVNDPKHRKLFVTQDASTL